MIGRRWLVLLLVAAALLAALQWARQVLVQQGRVRDRLPAGRMGLPAGAERLNSSPHSAAALCSVREPACRLNLETAP